MRRKEDRTSRILELLVREKKLEVAELSARLGVRLPLRRETEDRASRRRTCKGRRHRHDRERQLLRTSGRSAY